MATAAVEQRDTALSLCVPADDRHGWGFALLLATVATLFLRPADLLPAFEDWPIYQFLLVACLFVSARAAAARVTRRTVEAQPVTAWLLLLLVSVAASHLAHGFFWAARMSFYEVGKLVVLYLLLLALVNTPRRLLRFVQWLTISITVVAVLALLDRAEVISVAALEPIHSRDGAAGVDPQLVERIRGTGIFQDPNDFGLILVTGLTFCAAFFFRPATGWPRYLWLAPGAALLAALALTHSRGALLSLSCVFPAAVAYRRGWKFGLLAFLCLPLLALVFSSRMTDVSAVNVGTGQSRIQAWSDSLSVFRQHPLFGLGAGLLVDECGMVTHNSFLHCYAELGLFGGTAFLTCFLAAGLGLWSLRTQVLQPRASDHTGRELDDLAHLRVFIFSAVAAYAAGIVSLSRQFVAPTYLLLALAAVTTSLHGNPAPAWQRGEKFVALALLASAAFLAATHVAVRLLVSW